MENQGNTNKLYKKFLNECINDYSSVLVKDKNIDLEDYYDNRKAPYRSMSSLSEREKADIMVALVLKGDSCSSCLHCNDPYGQCPWEPDARYEKPVLSGVQICPKHTNGPFGR